MFLMAYEASTHKTKGTTPTSMVFGKELRLSYDLLLGAPPNKKHSTTDYVVLLMVPLP